MRVLTEPPARHAIRSDLLLDARGFARQVAQIIKLRAAHAATTLHTDVADRRAVRLKHTLHAFAVRDFAHSKRRVEPAVALGNDHAFIRLHAFAVAFDHLHV